MDLKTKITNIKNLSRKEQKEFAELWVVMGLPCIFRYGLAWKGASAKVITREKAMSLLPKYSFGMGFYELSFVRYNGEDALEFNELGENDMY